MHVSLHQTGHQKTTAGIHNLRPGNRRWIAGHHGDDPTVADDQMPGKGG
jgi:hypothetical protein